MVLLFSKIYDKGNNFDFDIVNFPFLDGDIPRASSDSVYPSQLSRFNRVSSHVADFNTRNKILTCKLLKQGYRYHKHCKTFSKFYRGQYDPWYPNSMLDSNLFFKTACRNPNFMVPRVHKFR